MSNDPLFPWFLAKKQHDNCLFLYCRKLEDLQFQMEEEAICRGDEEVW